MTSGPLPPFHLAIPVHDIEAARHFYGEVLGFGRGRSAERWTDWDVDYDNATRARTSSVRGWAQLPVKTSN